MSHDESPGAYEPELRARLMADADDPDVTAQLIAEFEEAARREAEIEDKQGRELEAIVDGQWEVEIGDDDEDDDDDDGRLRLADIRYELADARRDHVAAEKTHEHLNADWQRTSDRIADLDERFSDLDRRPEVVDVELGGLYAVSEMQWTQMERQDLKLDLVKLREQHFAALLPLVERVRDLEAAQTQERALAYSSDGDCSSATTASLVLWLAVPAAVVFAGAAVNELSYVSDHPHAYGPAKVIAWACGAGFLISVAVAVMVRELASRLKGRV